MPRRSKLVGNLLALVARDMSIALDNTIVRVIEKEQGSGMAKPLYS